MMRSMHVQNLALRKVYLRMSSLVARRSIQQLKQKRNLDCKDLKVQPLFQVMHTSDVRKMRHQQMSMVTMVTWKEQPEILFENLVLQLETI